jgi:hypothetical protein
VDGALAAVGGAVTASAGDVPLNALQIELQINVEEQWTSDTRGFGSMDGHMVVTS